MTADDAPRTLFEAVVRDLQDVAYRGALDVALYCTPPSTPERTAAVETARRAYEDGDARREAEKLIAYLAEHFVPGLDGAAPRLNDERPPEIAAQREPGTRTFRVTTDNPLADLWRDHLEARPTAPTEEQ